MTGHSEYLKKKHNSAAENNSMTDGMFDFYREIYLAQEKCTFSPDTISGYKDFLRSNELPYLSVDEIVLDDEIKSVFFRLLVNLTDIISISNPGMEFSHLKENFEKDADELFKGLLKQDYSLLEEKGRKNHLALDEFIFVIHNVFKPFLVELGKQADLSLDREDWSENRCPFCGYLPDMSKIVESKDNRKYLHCSICESEWEFPRLVCPACGCDDQTKNGFFEYADNDIYRVYYCDECRHYVKNIRIPKLKEESSYDLAVEDVLTSFLDSSMIEKGYKRI